MSEPTVAIPAWIAQAALPLLLDEWHKMRARADADPRWQAEALRLRDAVRALRAVLAR